ncbi:MAG: hypothetical protein Q8R53_00105 [Nanoarchaeota archaeon]|nr:hypothetical protein [Nanoarchaeota archaeon]
MVKLNRVYLRLANDEYERVKINSRVKGFSHVSEYLRSVALEQDAFFQEKVIQIDRNVKKILELVEKI